MPLNKSKGNMYPWVSHTFNAFKGECPHDCSYCYMKRFPQSPLHLDWGELKTDLGKGNFVFVGSSCDMWVSKIHAQQIKSILAHCLSYSRNRYLFQSKNPMRFLSYQDVKLEAIWGTTIETNCYFPQYMGKAPSPHDRMVAMLEIEQPTMVSIEPIMDFDLDEMVRYIRLIRPEFVSIGADSRGHNLPEPSADKVTDLIEELRKLTEVKVKDNLKRIFS